MPSETVQVKTARYTVTASATTAEGEASVTITTSAPDRSKDRVEPGGANLANYLKNPVVMFAHRYGDIPVGTCTAVESTSEGISARFRWLENDPFADRVRNAWDQGVLRGASIGFLPTKWTYDEERRGYDYLEWEMLEWSICAIPCNPEAVRALVTMGLPVEQEREDLSALRTEIADLTAAVKALADKPAVVPPPATTDALAITLAEDDFFELADESDELKFDAGDATTIVSALIRDELAKQITAAVQHARGRVD